MARTNDLLHGTSRDIVAANVKKLRAAGHPEHVATHIALKHARKGKGAQRVTDRVSAKPMNPNKVKITKSYV